MTHELEKELHKRITTHKYNIIAASLIMFEEEGIYETDLLKGKYGDDKISERGKDRAFKVADELEEKADQKTYDEIYEMCWKRARHRLTNKLYDLDM
jgi:hypothetical protein